MMPDFPYEQAPYVLQPGDVVCLVTDGVTEAMDADKQQYGEKRLTETIAAAPASAQGVLKAVLGDVAEHVGDTYQSDDLTCVCFGVSAEDDEEVLAVEFFEEE
jgi:sigma-B regulation protein RsbU (phosphoserine phosphatase)